jgi:membrane protease subunit HflK
MNETIKKYLKNTFVSFSKYFVIVIVAGLFVVYLLTGFYKVSENELGVLQRFGKVIDGSVEPGAHYKIPWPVDTITRVPVKTTHTLEIKDLSPGAAAGGENGPGQTTRLPSYCITGDNNIVFIDFLIRYNITDPVQYLFNIKSNEEYLKHIACASAVYSLAGKTVDDILTVGKKGVEIYLKEEIQGKLDQLNSGLGISAIEIGEVTPQRSVRTFFERVINAQIQQRELVNNAESYRNENLPKAKGEAMKVLEESRAYKYEVVSHAEGDAERFKKQLNEYSKARRVTKQRMYLDFIKEKFPALKNIVIVDNSGEKRIIDLRMLSN